MECSPGESGEARVTESITVLLQAAGALSDAGTFLLSYAGCLGAKGLVTVPDLAVTPLLQL